ncbi:bifunctional phosphoribosylaminoimidazolecarboxamide formyltransferase/IMP cyclohydrolase [Rickettsiales bacterium]|nr:bifunctional phosphoribosylaminoimidazolecarboxamide formyltransferase/IMP cyclohydrolase [Rickettsiales bacterium]
MTKIKIKRALISVSDKTNIIDLAKFLEEKNIEIISTGGTYNLLKQNNINVINISDFTKFPEILSGRVKTLHPKIHGGLLAIPDNEEHIKEANENNIKPIDLTIINLYPFMEHIKKGSDKDLIRENIDIGGPSMIRSTAKNYHYKTIITNIDDYQILQDQINDNNGQVDFEFREKMAKKAFNVTANYDANIANWFNNLNQDEDITQNILISGDLKQTLRYGENSHQEARIYQDNFKKTGIAHAQKLQGKDLSYNNFNDSDAALAIITEFEKASCVIVKHANPCGVATSDDILESYKKAFESDSKSAFGGIVALNRKVEEDLALEISKIFFEVIIAPDFSKEALEILSKKKNLRLLKTNIVKLDQKFEVKTISGGFLTQEIDNKIINIEDLNLASKAKIPNLELEELAFAMKICKYVKSNAIVVTSNMQTIGIGCGQQNRVDSVEIACKKAINFNNSNKFLASDAFFPFADNIEIAAKYGIKAIIAPSGSIRDKEVIDACDKHNIALYFLQTRHFKH